MTSIHLKSAWDHIRRSPFQAIAAVFVLATTFFVATMLAILVYSSSQAIKYFETRPQVIAFIKDNVTSEKISLLQNKLISDMRVKDVRYVSKDEALEIYKNATSDKPLLSELVSPDIFPASLEFSLNDLSFAESVIEEIKKEDIVDEVGFTANLGGESTLSDVVGRLRKITWYLRVGGGIYVTIQLGVSFLVLMIIIGMRMSTRKEEIQILDLIGATSSFIRSPIILEAIIYAISGVFIGWLIALILVLYTTPTVISYFAEIPVLPKDTSYLFYLLGLILLAELFLGILLALIGSMIALLRSRKNK